MNPCTYQHPTSRPPCLSITTYWSPPVPKAQSQDLLHHPFITEDPDAAEGASPHAASTVPLGGQLGNPDAHASGADANGFDELTINRTLKRSNTSKLMVNPSPFVAASQGARLPIPFYLSVTRRPE